MHDYTIPLFMTYLEGLTLQYIAVAIIVLIALIILIRRIATGPTTATAIAGVAPTDPLNRWL